MTEDKNYLPPELAAQLLEREALVTSLGDDIRELFTLLNEECVETIKELCEVGQYCTKILRFGLTVNPWTGIHNRDGVEKELGDVFAAARVLNALGAIDLERINAHADAKVAALRANDGRLRHAKIPEGA